MLNIRNNLMHNYSDTGRLPLMREEIRKMAKKAHIVSNEWVSKCIEKNVLIGERNFEPV